VELARQGGGGRGGREGDREAACFHSFVQPTLYTIPLPPFFLSSFPPSRPPFLPKVTSDSSAPGLSIGSTYTLHFKDGTEWGIVIMEASELHK